jgi:hypothetical protein
MTMVDELREQVRGVVITPGDEGYQQARRVYNAMIEPGRRWWCGAPTSAT